MPGGDVDGGGEGSVGVVLLGLVVMLVFDVVFGVVVGIGGFFVGCGFGHVVVGVAAVGAGAGVGGGGCDGVYGSPRIKRYGLLKIQTSSFELNVAIPHRRHILIIHSE